MSKLFDDDDRAALLYTVVGKFITDLKTVKLRTHSIHKMRLNRFSSSHTTFSAVSLKSLINSAAI